VQILFNAVHLALRRPHVFRANLKGERMADRRSTASGFTLVELLVVIGLIGLLISILLPALRKARQSAEQIACLSNIKQVTFGFFSYSLENKVIPGAALEGNINLDWCGESNAIYQNNPHAYTHPIQSSVLRKYLGTDKILTCPTAGRPNQLFDYTMVYFMAGAKTNLPWRMSYPVHPQSSSSPRAYFQGIPLLIEENQFFYNAPIDDGSWGNLDEFSHRHHGGCNVAYLDGSAGYFKSPTNPRGDGFQSTQDLCCNNVLLETVWGNFGTSSPYASDYGWANHPH
jgi:prepilin-type N-terminal cleavage/methylation domain-containing protein/prepilin-type processing-associated H-X9-DG protein